MSVVSARLALRPASRPSSCCTSAGPRLRRRRAGGAGRAFRTGVALRRAIRSGTDRPQRGPGAALRGCPLVATPATPLRVSSSRRSTGYGPKPPLRSERFGPSLVAERGRSSRRARESEPPRPEALRVEPARVEPARVEPPRVEPPVVEPPRGVPLRPVAPAPLRGGLPDGVPARLAVDFPAGFPELFPAGFPVPLAPPRAAPDDRPAVPPRFAGGRPWRSPPRRRSSAMVVRS